MKKNMGATDAHARTIAAIIFIIIALFTSDYPVLTVFLAIAAAILAGSAFLRYCPLYTPFKRDTRSAAERAGDPVAASSPAEPPAEPNAASEGAGKSA